VKTKLYLFVILLITLLSCENKQSRNALLPSVSGKAGEVVFVINDDYWESEIGDQWKKICNTIVVGLPQPEPMFDLVRIPNDAFSKIFKSHRNIVLMKLSSKTDSAFMQLQKDIWAKPQLLITINAPDKASYLEFIKKNKQKILDILLGAERNRIVNNYKSYEERGIRKQLEQKHFLSMKIPKGYTMDVDDDNFVWISHETPYISQGIFIYYQDYTDTLQLGKDYLVKNRNSILKKNVPGSLPDSYMTTDTVFPINYDQFYLKDLYIAELKGLWRSEGDFMGGPFQSFTTIDETRNRVITVDTYVYAPKFDKRNYMRQLEAIMFTFEVIKEIP